MDILSRLLFSLNNISCVWCLFPTVLPLPPVATDIPFPSFMKVPTPFSSHCNEAFATCHLPAMTAPDFIEKGSWTEYLYGGQKFMDIRVSIFEGSPRLHPIEGLKFSTKQLSNDPNILDLCSTKFISVFGWCRFEGQTDIERLWENDHEINHQFMIDGRITCLSKSKSKLSCALFGIVASMAGVVRGVLLTRASRTAFQPMGVGYGYGKQSGLKKARWYVRRCNNFIYWSCLSSSLN